MKLWNDRHLSLTLTRLGAQVLVAMLVVGAFSVNTGNNLLYVVFSLMLGLFLVSGVLSRRALQGLQVVGLEGGNLFARAQGGLRLRLGGRTRRRIRGLELHLALDSGHAEPGFLGATDEGGTSLTLRIRPEHRGTLLVRRLELRTSFPFGLLEKSLFLDLDHSLLILPHPRMPPAHPVSWRGEGNRSTAREGSVSPEGARPLRQGDAPGRVHWKRTAQQHQPWVRTFEDERPVGLHLRLEPGAWAPGRSFERELERLSGAVLQARIQRREVSLELDTSSGLRVFRGHVACWQTLARAKAEGTAGSIPLQGRDIQVPLS